MPTSTDEQLGVKVHVSAQCDIFAQATIVLGTICDANDHIVQTKVTLEPGNPAAGIEDSWCSLGAALVYEFTFGNIDPASLLNDAVSKAMRGISAFDLGKPPGGIHFAFTGDGGFGVRGGSICDCTQSTCAGQGFTCGPIPDGCGGTLDCGTCMAGTCSGGVCRCNRLYHSCTVDADCCSGFCDSSGGPGTGFCSPICPTGQTNCGGICVYLASDNNNCGACGAVCPQNESCSGASCTCAAPSTLCPSTRCNVRPCRCVDPLSDPNNCGGCGNVCPFGGGCAQGVCCLAQGSACTDNAQCCSTFCASGVCILIP